MRDLQLAIDEDAESGTRNRFVDGVFPWGYSFIMSSVKDVKAATEGLSPEERWELYRWLGESTDVQRFREEELRREIAVGIEQADRGEVAPLDIGAVKTAVRSQMKKKAR